MANHSNSPYADFTYDNRFLMSKLMSMNGIAIVGPCVRAEISNTWLKFEQPVVVTCDFNVINNIGTIMRSRLGYTRQTRDRPAVMSINTDILVINIEDEDPEYRCRETEIGYLSPEETKGIPRYDSSLVVVDSKLPFCPEDISILAEVSVNDSWKHDWKAVVHVIQDNNEGTAVQSYVSKLLHMTKDKSFYLDSIALINGKMFDPFVVVPDIEQRTVDISKVVNYLPRYCVNIFKENGWNCQDLLPQKKNMLDKYPGLFETYGTPMVNNNSYITFTTSATA